MLYPSIKACLEKVNWRHPKEHKEELSDFNVTLVDQKATQKLLTKALDSLKAPEGSSWGWCLAAIVVPSEGHLVGIRNNIKNTFPYRISYKLGGYTCQRFSPALGNLGCQGFYQEAPALVQSSDVPEAGWDHRINPPKKWAPQGFRIYLRYRAGLQGLQEEHGWQCSDAIAAENFLGHQGASVEDRERVSKTMFSDMFQSKKSRWTEWTWWSLAFARPWRRKPHAPRPQLWRIILSSRRPFGRFSGDFRFFFQLKGGGGHVEMGCFTMLKPYKSNLMQSCTWFF